MRNYPLPKNDRTIETRDVAEYCAKMCRELSDMARSQRLDLLRYLLLLAQKEAEAQSGGLPDPVEVEGLDLENNETG
ncbi:hypothetical protein PsW64_03123 [Pseudovibrio sp. W64]|uniref:hypothetical protein n=1 Tax=Pseudovibrio sp. W64 TaxID=1735583 RepID=UPI0007B20E67|nr:hypothetical protein [Pseudovibrio sp. W64]KZK79493.1 hypothetical protein PsW64_03123 [Pseudovibrio sp. W64]KZL00607.1 hypothetical protein PsW74_02207 [Pseudovibrio sp. W74]KZL06797.1 hypothetical protein PsAD14_04256 [Pseudovibrio sp. Ad14]